MAPQALQILQDTEIGENQLWRRVEPLNKEEKTLCNRMMKYLSKIALNQKIAQALLATRKDIESLYRHRESNKLLEGWREAIVGDPLLVFVSEQQSARQAKRPS